MLTHIEGGLYATSNTVLGTILYIEIQIDDKVINQNQTSFQPKVWINP